ncbi:MAG: histidine phosphatase family protein [Planctomycetes bacterium]|nr:histidine phosphatase family protein [Planctomycetota bacterium]
MTRRLWLVRHGETAGQSSIRFHGKNDVPLSDEGRAQIRALAPWLAGAQFTAIVHSPQSRAVESAAILAEACGFATVERRADERLREISFGDCEGLTAEEIEARFPEFWREHRAGRALAFPNGEPRADYAARVAAAARELVAEPWSGDLLVVAHRGTVRQFGRALLGFPSDAEDPFAVGLGSLTILRQDPGSAAFRLELLGALP